MWPFIDAYVIGEGVEVIHDIVNVHKKWKEEDGKDRNELLKSLAQVMGVYVPSLYEAHYMDDETIAEVLPLVPEAPKVIMKRLVAKLPPPPTNFIVPNIKSVHNRATVEVMRGCTRGCRFCHAGFATRPVRERSVDEVVEVAEKALASTGYEEVSFLSLSSSDYTGIAELVKKVNERFPGETIGVSLPSLRIESVSVDLMDGLKRSRATGFTLAPEAATERMRRIINK